MSFLSMSRPLKLKIGQTINKLTYLEEIEPYYDKFRMMRRGVFECVCGNTKELIIQNVMSNNTKSCGCQRKEKRK
jgi:hypothetical protein